MDKFIIGVIAVIALALSGFGLLSSTKEQPVGGSSPESFEHLQAREGITIGGRVLATSSIGAATYTAANFRNVSLIQHTAASALTATLPASSTLSDFVRFAGDSRTIYLAPVTTGITLAGGTGTLLNSASSTSETFCSAGTLCRLDFVRKTDTDIEVLLTPSI